jgi:hypothetical protein
MIESVEASRSWTEEEIVMIEAGWVVRLLEEQ